MMETAEDNGRAGPWQEQLGKEGVERSIHGSYQGLEHY